MNKIVFSKYEGLGNDFIIIDESQQVSTPRDPFTPLSLRRHLCHRKLGIGADGVITLLPPLHDGSSVFMHVTNSDGSIPENCGNGLRCVARWLLDNTKIRPGDVFGIDTFSGTKQAQVREDGINVELGLAKVDLEFADPQIIQHFHWFAQETGAVSPKLIAHVDLGNPHIVVETADLENAQALLGPKLEKLGSLPNGANVSFVRRESSQSIALRVWERGAGATEACGSGAGASVAALIAYGMFPSDIGIDAHFKNGKLEVMAFERLKSEYSLEICGPAEKLFEGIWENSERIW